MIFMMGMRRLPAEGVALAAFFRLKPQMDTDTHGCSDTLFPSVCIRVYPWFTCLNNSG
jgi:hypothetical protein